MRKFTLHFFSASAKRKRHDGAHDDNDDDDDYCSLTAKTIGEFFLYLSPVYVAKKLKILLGT
jgi:hypothetical protein